MLDIIPPVIYLEPDCPNCGPPEAAKGRSWSEDDIFNVCPNCGAELDTIEYHRVTSEVTKKACIFCGTRTEDYEEISVVTESRGGVKTSITLACCKDPECQSRADMLDKFCFDNQQEDTDDE